MKDLLLYFRFVFGLLAIALDTIIFGTLITLVAPFSERAFIWIMENIWIKIILRVAGVELEVHGAEKVDAAQPHIYMSNHQSHLDIPCYFEALPQHIRFVAKKSLFYIPFFGVAMWSMGHIIIDRSNRRRAFTSVKRAGEKIRGGTSVFFFAEGTRTLDRSIGPFKKGGIILAIESGVPIIPCAINGTFDILPKGLHPFRPHKVIVSVGEPIETQGLGMEDKEALTAKVREAIIADFIPLPDSGGLNPDGSYAGGPAS